MVLVYGAVYLQRCLCMQQGPAALTQSGGVTTAFPLKREPLTVPTTLQGGS